MSLNSRFAKIRDEIQLTQTQFAKELSIHPSIISEIERGKREPSKDLLAKLALKYSINLHWVLTGEGPMYVGPASSSSPIAVEIPVLDAEENLERMLKTVFESMKQTELYAQIEVMAKRNVRSVLQETVFRVKDSLQRDADEKKRIEESSILDSRIKEVLLSIFPQGKSDL